METIRIYRFYTNLGRAPLKYYTSEISVWAEKTGLLVQILLHQDQRNKVFKDDITCGVIVQTKVELLTENFENIDPVLLSKL